MANASIPKMTLKSYEEELEGEEMDGRAGVGGASGGRPARPGYWQRFRPTPQGMLFCVEHVNVINYKDVQMLQRFLMITPRSCHGEKNRDGARHQPKRLALHQTVPVTWPYCLCHTIALTTMMAPPGDGLVVIIPRWVYQGDLLECVKSLSRRAGAALAALSAPSSKKKMAKEKTNQTKSFTKNRCEFTPREATAAEV